MELKKTKIIQVRELDKHFFEKVPLIKKSKKYQNDWFYSIFFECNID